MKASARPPATRKIPEPGEGKRGAAGHPAYLVRQAASAVRGALDRELAPLGVTHPQFIALVMLDAYPAASGAQVARLALLTPQTLTVILANLERARLVRRRRSDANRRVILHELTPSGTATLASCKQIAARVEAEMMAGVSPADASVILAWLAGVAVTFAR